MVYPIGWQSRDNVDERGYVMFAQGLDTEAAAISDARDSLDGPEDLDQGILL